MKGRRNQYKSDARTVAEHGMKHHKPNGFILKSLITNIITKCKNHEQQKKKKRLKLSVRMLENRILIERCVTKV
jgi:hypothetical protein